MTDLTRTTQFSGTRKPATSAAPARDLDQEQFEKQCVDYQAPTAIRPALLTADEARALAQTYTTGQGRLKALRTVIAHREAYLDEQAGRKPFDELTADQRAKAAAFFKAHGYALAGQPKAAPPNPVKAAAAPAKVESPPAESKPAEATPPAPLPDNLAGATRGLVVAPPSATLEIEFVSAQGFTCRLTLHAPSGTMVLEQGGAAMAKLVQQQAKPPAREPAVVVAAPGSAAELDSPPLCAIHHTPMEQRQGKNGKFWSCPKKLDDGSWCPYRPK